MRHFITASAILACSAAALSAQPAAPANPLTAELKQAYDRVTNNLLRMAEKMPEENYSFKPAAEIRDFRETMAHTIDYQMRTCSMVNGEAKSVDAASKKTRAGIVEALKTSMAECAKAIDSMTDQTAVQMMSGGRGPQRTRLGTLYGIVGHNNEEYGYLAVYLRLKGIVPPSSEGGGMAPGAPARRGGM
jgi:uncharacterized damage-inducible protein DinB